MLLRESDIFEIEYNNDDISYIDDVIEVLNNNYKRVMDFFELEKFSRNPKIKFWNSIDEYRNFFNEKMKKYNKRVQEWEVGRGTNNSHECRIDLLSFGERLKCKGHDKDTIETFLKVIVHEFVHVCQFEYSDRTFTLTWFNEALATNLANQYEDVSLFIDASLDEVLKGRAKYVNYYLMGKYLINNYSKDYILELSKDNNLVMKDTSKIYDGALEYIEKLRVDDYKKVNSPEELLSFMNKYIRYGLRDDDGKIYEWGQDGFQKVCEEKWRSKDGVSVVKSGYGHCFDQTEIERDWFSKHGYEFKTLFIIFEFSEENNYMCHTYLVYEDKSNGTWNWFEHADNNNRGIHVFNSVEKAVLAQKEKHIESNRNIGLLINDEIISKIHIYEYFSPKVGSSNQEFLDNIFENGKEVNFSKSKKR